MTDLPDLPDLPSRLRFARSLAVSLSSRELDNLAGNRTPGHEAMIESRLRPNPEALRIGKLSVILGVSTDWLILGKGPLPQAEDVRAAVQSAREEYALAKANERDNGPPSSSPSSPPPASSKTPRITKATKRPTPKRRASTDKKAAA